MVLLTRFILPSSGCRGEGSLEAGHLILVGRFYSLSARLWYLFAVLLTVYYGLTLIY